MYCTNSINKTGTSRDNNNRANKRVTNENNAKGESKENKMKMKEKQSSKREVQEEICVYNKDKTVKKKEAIKEEKKNILKK